MTLDLLDLLSSAPEQVPDLETILVHRDYFGLTTASDLQRAICRILDGKSLLELAHCAPVINALGGAEACALLPNILPKQLLLLAGIRSGKSLLAAACITRAALTCDVSKLGPGEIPRAAIVSLTRDTAQPTWDHVYGRIMASPKLSKLLIGKPKADSLLIKHPSGRPVEITVVAGAKAAGTLVARWLAGVVFDEAPRMAGQDDAVINLNDQLTGIQGRLLPGAQVIMSGSPWAPFGPAWDLFDKHWGKPSKNLCVIRARGPDMNPIVWTTETCSELKERDPDAYRVDVDCEFMDPESGLLALHELEPLRRQSNIPQTPLAGHYYSAAIDPATRGNAWTLIVIERSRLGAIRVVLNQQWVGTSAKPLSPSDVFAELSSVLAPYNIYNLHTDQWAADSLVEIAAQHNLWLVSHNVTDKLKLEMFNHLRALVHDKKLELPNDLVLLRDLASVKKKVTATGVTIHLPQQGSGRHCDYAPALALALMHPPREPDPERPVFEDEQARIMAELKEQARRQVAQQVSVANKQLGRNLRWGKS